MNDASLGPGRLLDSSIAQMVLPRLEHEFSARLSTVSWVAIVYLLVMAAFLRSSAMRLDLRHDT